jgi:chromosome segregation ATPase
MYKEPFLQLLRLRNCLEQRCLALELAVGTREAELRSLEAHSAGLAMANDAIAAELSTRDVELEALCLRCQASQDAADQLRRELVEARTSLTKSLMAHQAASEHGSMQLAQKDRSIAVLDAEVLSLRMQLEAMRPALLSLTAPQSERGSTAGSVRPASGSTAKRTAKK